MTGAMIRGFKVGFDRRGGDAVPANFCPLLPMISPAARLCRVAAVGCVVRARKKKTKKRCRKGIIS